MGKNLVTAQIRGETRALCLGAVMVVCSAITYYILGTTVLPLHQKSVWSKASICHLIETDIRDHEKLDGKKVPQYPCLWVNVSAIGKSAILYHTEETKEKNCQACTGENPYELLQRPARANRKTILFDDYSEIIKTSSNKNTIIMTRLGPEEDIRKCTFPLLCRELGDSRYGPSNVLSDVAEGGGQSY
ncbi:calcium-activated potassium channel subunit beta-1 isoform X2 [Notamacropus eugenii]|uniref:calcium-activated potassium channel subunit beta-1 isoform X2 n=1 Tax=Notamacropus eugenii TaxID=9315 RepID=UPI003B683B49